MPARLRLPLRPTPHGQGERDQDAKEIEEYDHGRIAQDEPGGEDDGDEDQPPPLSPGTNATPPCEQDSEADE